MQVDSRMIALVIVISLYVVCSAVLLAFGAQCYILTFLFLRKRRQRVTTQRETMKYYYTTTDETLYPKVVTQLPMYNEKQVACRVIEAAAAMDYPRSRHEIQILDDSTDETVTYVDAMVKKFKALGYNISAIRRGEDRTGFKAGALQNGLRFTDAEFVTIFDADFVPTVDFLRRAMAFFVGRPNLGLVQGRWTHLNKNASLITRGQAMGSTVIL
jgi:cellulose synthase/poly-beta-1,6-N-acetylglucosamine synthase-like glycosyltransferase